MPARLTKLSPPVEEPIRAAGAVLWRHGASGKLEVCLAHRPRYGDWSFPKGKLKPGEHPLLGARRELLEETGFEVFLGRSIGVQSYPMGDRLKIVQYWSAQVGEGSFTPNREVDELWWAPPAEAVGLLSYDRDVHLLDAMTAAQVDTVPVVVMRHCASMSRSAHHGPGEERTLSDAGFVHAAVLAEILACYGKLRVVCSPARRCVDSVIPYAQANGLPVHMDPGLAEAAVGSQDPARVLRGALARNRPALLCTHRPVLPELFPGFAVPDRTADELLLPGEFMVLHTSAGKVVAMDRHTPY